MTPGDIFKTDGYTEVAVIHYAEDGGEAVVFSNDSSHYLVAVRMPGSDEAELEYSFSYYNENEDGAPRLRQGRHPRRRHRPEPLTRRHARPRRDP